MAKKQSSVRPYESRYGYEWIKFSDYIGEIMCGRKAAQEKRVVPQNFKEDSHWNSFFRQQVYFADKLKSEFGKEPIFAMLKRQDCSWCFSLMSPKIRAIIVEEKRKLDAKFVEPETIVEIIQRAEAIEELKLVPVSLPSSISARKKTSISKLDD